MAQNPSLSTSRVQKMRAAHGLVSLPQIKNKLRDKLKLHSEKRGKNMRELLEQIIESWPDA